MPARRRARATTATCFPRRAAMRRAGPGPQFLRLRRAAAEDRDGSLNQEPASARVAGLGDRAPPLCLARAVLAGHEAEVGFELTRVVEALGIVDGGEEGGSGDGADAGDGESPTPVEPA